MSNDDTEKANVVRPLEMGVRPAMLIGRSPQSRVFNKQNVIIELEANKEIALHIGPRL